MTINRLRAGRISALIAATRNSHVDLVYADKSRRKACKYYRIWAEANPDADALS